ncbi:MAG: VWA domain-containing protein [Desulfobacteraceae bacterium]|nr:VWA domain-containing protein [Desulfobacteraceae bacterium]MBC2757229.1 VWA domain-containing protein [Desulfobacteraceae bacterium]
MKKLFVLVLAVFIHFFLVFIHVPNSVAESFPEVMFVLDASGSMWGQVDGQAKISIVRQVMHEIVPALPHEVRVGLTAYGHNRKGDCADIEILVPPGSDDRNGILSYIDQINPKGMTPIAGSVERVTEALKNRENETTVILLSDGEETCHDSPCQAIRELKALGIKFILHVVGFDINDQQKAQLACMAEAGGGQYFEADNAQALLAAFQSLQNEVAQKVEKAKTIGKKAVSRLGKLRITMPASATISLNTFKIIRKADGKLVKTVKDPGADSIHPLLSGDYEVVAGFANSNYKPDSDVSLGVFTVTGGETLAIDLGVLVFNIADTLKKIPAGAVIVTRADNPEFSLTLPYTGNDYYFYKPKPLPAGTYHFAVHYQRGYLYKTDTTPVVLAKNIQIQKGLETVVTIDSGISIKEPADSELVSWELVPQGSDAPAIKINRASNGSYPLWKTYAVMPGTYNLLGYIEGMDEPLPLGEGLTISNGDLIEFDTGL